MMVWEPLIPISPSGIVIKAHGQRNQYCVVLLFVSDPSFRDCCFSCTSRTTVEYRGSQNGHIRRNDLLVTAFDFFCRQTVAQSLLDIRASNRLTKRIQDNLGFWIPLRGFRIPGTGFQSLSVELRFWIPIVSGIPDSLSCIPDSKAQDSGFHKQKFLEFRNPDFRFKIPFSNVINLNVF